jgi:hypothetical protein
MLLENTKHTLEHEGEGRKKKMKKKTTTNTVVTVLVVTATVTLSLLKMVKLILCTTKVNISRNVEVQFNSFLTSALYEGEWSAVCPGSFIPHRKSPQYLLHRKLGGSQSQAQCFAEEKNILSLAIIKSKFLSC